MKGKIGGEIESSPYFDSKLMLDDKPLELIPYYEIGHQHFISADAKN